MKIVIAIFLLAALTASSQTPQGKWLDITNEPNGGYLYFGGDKPLIVEDYEVLQTHEVCATVTGFFLKKSQLGRYDVRFRGMRTTAEFVFTTQYDAEHWVQRFCTPESLTGIRKGRGTFARNY